MFELPRKKYLFLVPNLTLT